MYLEVSDLLAALLRMKSDEMDVIGLELLSNNSVELTGYKREENIRPTDHSGHDFGRLSQASIHSV